VNRQADVFYRSPRPVLLATSARTASKRGTCSLCCGRPIAPGQRVADVADGRGVAHLTCAARLADGQPR